MKTHKQRAFCLLASAFLMLGAWIGEGLAEVKVGVILPMSGEFARYGEQVRKGLESARPQGVHYIYEDEGCDPKTAVTAHTKLTSLDQVKIIIGPWCGSPQVSVASMLVKNKQIAILGSSAPRRVFELSAQRMLSVQHSIEEESIFNARQLYQRGARRVVIVFLENAFSRAHEAAFRENFKGEVLETLVYSTPDASALRSIALKVKQLSADSLYVPDAFPLMHNLVSQLDQIGLKDLPIYSVYSAQSEDVLKARGKSMHPLFISYPRITEDALQYYPRLASEVLAKGLGQCPNADAECVVKAIQASYHFDQYGVMQGENGLKAAGEGKFTWIDTL